MRRRALIGLLPPVTILFLLPLGAGLGPGFLGLLSERVLGFLEPAVPVVLAALGVIVGLGLHVPRTRARGLRLCAAAGFQELLTFGLVAGGLLGIYRVVPATAETIPWFVAMAVGLSAAMSTRPLRSPAEGADTFELSQGTDAGFENLLPIALGCVLLAAVRESSVSQALLLTAQTGGAALLIALAGWLLIARGATEREQRIFLVGSVLLLGGAAEYLGLSALFAGMLAGIAWSVGGGPTSERIRQDVLHVRHPMIVFVLLVAGARAGLSLSIVAIALSYVVLRIVGKVVGGWADRMSRGPFDSPDDGLAVLAPGIVGVAFALNVFQAGAPGAASVLAIAVAGSFGAELVWLMTGRAEGDG